VETDISNVQKELCIGRTTETHLSVEWVLESSFLMKMKLHFFREWAGFSVVTQDFGSIFVPMCIRFYRHFRNFRPLLPPTHQTSEARSHVNVAAPPRRIERYRS
jgi:hypothetical protein